MSIINNGKYDLEVRHQITQIMKNKPKLKDLKDGTKFTLRNVGTVYTLQSKEKGVAIITSDWSGRTYRKKLSTNVFYVFPSKEWIDREKKAEAGMNDVPGIRKSKKRTIKKKK